MKISIFPVKVDFCLTSLYIKLRYYIFQKTTDGRVITTRSLAIAHHISDSIKRSISFHIRQLKSLVSHRELRTSLPNYAPKCFAREVR